MRQEMISVRTTVTVDEALLEKAMELTGITERSHLFRSGLEALVRIESARRLAALGASDPEAVAAPRRRGDVA